MMGRLEGARTLEPLRRAAWRLILVLLLVSRMFKMGAGGVVVLKCGRLERHRVLLLKGQLDDDGTDVQFFDGRPNVPQVGTAGRMMAIKEILPIRFSQN